MTVIYPNKNYDEDFRENKQDSPVYDLQFEKQRIAEGTEEIKKELFEKWNKKYANAPIFPDAILSVNPELVKFMLSFNLTLFYNDLAKKFNLSREQRDILPQIVWESVINKDWNKFENTIRTSLKADFSVASQIIQSINQTILLKAKDLSDKPFTSQKRITSQVPEIKIEKLSLSRAIQKYPAIGEKLITTNPIKLKIFPAPVRPSIKNWIVDYHQVVGAGSHGSIERANYLYHSENAKKLSQAERQRLAIILKSVDENEPVTVDSENLQIIFPAPEKEKNEKDKTVLSPPPAPSSPSPSSPLTMFTSIRQSNSLADFAEGQVVEKNRLGNNVEMYKRANDARDDFFQKNTSNAPSFFKKSEMPKKEDGNIKFSYPQKMSSDAPPISKKIFASENISVDTQKKSASFGYTPYKIRHLSYDNGSFSDKQNSKEDDLKTRGNVVDLRS